MIVILLWFVVGCFIGVGAAMLLYGVLRILFYIIYGICSLFDEDLM